MEVRIRPLIEEDAKISYQWRNNPEIFKYTGANYDHQITLGDETNWIRQVINNKNDYRCAIIADGQYVGNIYLTDIENGIGTYHIFIGEQDYWGKGIATKASEQLIDYAFKQLNLYEIRLKVKRQNSRAVSMYEKLGFQEYADDGLWCSMKLINE